MKYTQPYGVSDPNAPYVNGNPSTGTMGSIPPAASIEHPQREIHNFIADSRMTPTALDLRQLAKAVQSGQVIYSEDTGPGNLLLVTVAPVVTALIVGMQFMVKVANTNSAPMSVSVNGLAGRPLVHRDGSVMGAFEITAGSIISIVFDGTNFQLLSGGSGGGGGGIITMTAPRDFYVNASTGSDTAYDGTSATVGTGGVGPFQTIQKALSTMTKYNLGGFNFNIHVADGAYSGSNPLEFPTPNGSGSVQLVGNIANPAACIYVNNGSGTAWKVHSGGVWGIQGFALQAVASRPGDPGSAVWIGGNSTAYVGSTNFQNCPGVHFGVGPGGSASLSGNINVWGSGQAFINAFGNGIAFCNTGSPTAEPNINIATPGVNYSMAFAVAGSGGQVRALFNVMTGHLGTITGAKYYATANGVIDVGGRGYGYLPGNVGGSISNGGQYV